MKLIDNLLSKITMYRLMLYYLCILFVAAILFSAAKILPFNAVDITLTGSYLVIACYIFNYLFARFFKVKPNYESKYITGLILALIMGTLPLFPNLGVLTLAAFLAMGSKYLLVYQKQHIFNPAAFAAVGTGILLNQGASWWAGGQPLLPLTILGGLLIARRTRRMHLILSFFVTYVLLLLFTNPQYLTAAEFKSFLNNTFHSPVILFFTFVMLIEPITSPANRVYRIYFGILTGVLYIIFSATLPVFYTLELALITANLIGRIIYFSAKYSLVLAEKKEIGPGLWEFLFQPTKPLAFTAGQYLEWTVPHDHVDSRGNRRYFTISSSPTEKDIMLTVKVPDKSSTYKKALVGLKPGDSLMATNLEGEFTLDKKQDKSYIFIAGGIGITPFRSMIQYLLDKNQSLPITLFYTAHTASEFVFKDLLEKAEKQLGIKVVYVVSENPPKGWDGEVGHISPEIIQKHVKDYKSPTFYLSGPQPMIMAYREMLQKMGVSHIKTDYFPGYE